ncbi:hypothetical protein DV736_g4536, partial [Chaetothyriales sp. CBS 134916]
MTDAASQYRLRVTVGPSYDRSTHHVATPNANGLHDSDAPLIISTPSLTLAYAIRIRNFTGLPSSSPITSPYFEHPLHKTDQYSISFSFIPKVDIPGDELVFGNDFDRPIRDRLPPGFGQAFKFVKWWIDPGLEGDVYADRPYLYSPALCSWNTFYIGGKVGLNEADNAHARFPSAFCSSVVEEGAHADGAAVREESGMPADPAARKKFYLDPVNREAFVFEKGRLYQSDFFNPYLDFNDFSLKLPGFSLNVIKYVDAKTHELRYTLKNKATDELYAVVTFTLLWGSELEEAEKEDTGKEGDDSAGDDFKAKEEKSANDKPDDNDSIPDDDEGRTLIDEKMAVPSLYPDLSLPDIDLFSFLLNRKDRPFPDDKVIFQDADDLQRQYTFADIRSKAIDFGKGLRSVGELKKGDVLALVSPNDVDVPPVTLGALWAGVTVSPANPGYTVNELAYQFEDSQAKAVVAHLTVLENVKAAAAKVGIPESQIFIVGAKKDPSFKTKHWTGVRNLSGVSRYRQVKVDPKTDLAFLVYSSGTTGKPKGVELTHFNMTSNILQVQGSEGGMLTWDGSMSCPGIPDAPRPQGDKILACLPFFHIYGLNLLVLNPLYTGVDALVLARFEIEKFCRLIQEHKVTFLYVVPPMVLLLAKHPAVPKYDLSSLRMSNSGAAPLTRELVDTVYKRMGVRVKQGYGLSETAPVIFQQRWQDWDNGIGSCGRMVPNLTAKFYAVGSSSGEGDDGQPPKELAPGETGELYVKGPNIFSRYHNNPNATAECLEDGWFRTGDVGYIDKNGNLWITDRVKELIKYKGFQVPPAELEGYLHDHELVDDVCVVGVESTILGTEVPRAYVVRKGGLAAVQPGDDEKIVQWLNAKVANHKKLRGGVKFIDVVPKSVAGKILRRLLKDQAKKEYQELEAQKAKAKL